MRASMLLLMLVAILTTSSGPALAQEGTPIALPTTPSPRRCTTPELDAETLQQRIAAGEQLVEGGLSLEVLDFTETGDLIMPEGEPADEATVAAITAVAEEWVACVNAGKILRQLALFSDEWLYLSYSAPPLTDEEFAAMAATPVAVPKKLFGSLIAVHDARILPDGRVGALVETAFPEAPPKGVEVDYLLFVQRDGRWFIDDIVDGLEDQFPPA